jgi:L-serine dehydratase
VARIAWLARKMFDALPGKVIIKFYGSLAATWKGHGSADAAIAALLGIAPEDEDLSCGRQKLREMEEKGQGFSAQIIPVPELPLSWHPNTLVLELFSKDNETAHLNVRAASIGGGSICINEINGYEVELSGELEALLVIHHDEVGVIAKVSQILAANAINMAATRSHRKEKGEEAMLVVETDSAIPVSVIREMEALPPVFKVLKFPSISS